MKIRIFTLAKELNMDSKVLLEYCQRWSLELERPFENLSYNLVIPGQTAQGAAVVLNGRSDWVYEEEIFNRNPRSYWWCPDEPVLAFLRYDDKPVRKFPVAQAFPANTRKRFSSATTGRNRSRSSPRRCRPGPVTAKPIAWPGPGTRRCDAP